jgi:hypothetical protein
VQKAGERERKKNYNKKLHRADSFEYIMKTFIVVNFVFSSRLLSSALKHAKIIQFSVTEKIT